METKHAAAHQIAKHLRNIAALLPSLSAEGVAAILPGWKPDDCDIADFVTLYAEKASRLEATAPFEPITEGQKVEIREECAESIADLNMRERADLVTEDWTEAEWRMEQDDRDEYMREDDE